MAGLLKKLAFATRKFPGSQPCSDSEDGRTQPAAVRKLTKEPCNRYRNHRIEFISDYNSEDSDYDMSHSAQTPGKGKGKIVSDFSIDDTLTDQSAFKLSNKQMPSPREMSDAELTLLQIQNQSRSGTARGEPVRGEGSVQQVSMGVADKARPRLLLMGQRRSGKSSISSVVFHKLPPQETLFLESTARVQNDKVTSFMDIQVWDFPGQLDIFTDPTFDQDSIFGEVGALIWVIDAQDDYLEAVERLNQTTLHLHHNYPHINIEIFIHKVDGLSDDYRLDIQRDIVIRVQDELSDQNIETAPVNFHMTSIYNHSIFEAFSKVIQKLIPRLGTLESMLTNLCRTCHFEKAYLFDVASKIYIATDSSPADMPSYEICSDFIDVILDITEVFGTWTRPTENIKRLEGSNWAEGAPETLEDQVAFIGAESCLVLHEGDRPIILRDVDKHLALVAIMEAHSYDKTPLVTMNVETIAKGLTQFFEITKRK